MTPSRLLQVIETFAERISSSVFGVGKTFRDTPQCREIVMQYLCLYYGSDNEMYTNYCIYQEKTDPVSQVKELSQRAPCHSFCVQVGQICANEPGKRLTDPCVCGGPCVLPV